MIEAGSIEGITKILRIRVARFAFVSGDAFGFAETFPVVAVTGFGLIIAEACGAVVSLLRFAPEAVFTGFAMISFCVSTTLPAFV